jgi:hypothetical protein
MKNLKADDLVPSYDWFVVEDPALDGASKDEVRRRFRQLRTSLLETELPDDLDDYKKLAITNEWPRYNFCIHVGSEALQSALDQGCAYSTPTSPSSSHVNVIRADDSWENPDFDRFDWAKYEAVKEIEKKRRRESDDGAVEGDEDDDEEDDDEDDEFDGPEPEIEGSRLHDVGRMKVRADSLLQAYASLQKVWSWDHIYQRPPLMVEC